MQKSKLAVCGGLTNSCEKKRCKKQRRKGKIGKKRKGFSEVIMAGTLIKCDDIEPFK